MWRSVTRTEILSIKDNYEVRKSVTRNTAIQACTAITFSRSKTTCVCILLICFYIDILMFDSDHLFMAYGFTTFHVKCGSTYNTGFQVARRNIVKKIARMKEEILCNR